jgi:hypothetical protein
VVRLCGTRYREHARNSNYQCDKSSHPWHFALLLAPLGRRFSTPPPRPLVAAIVPRSGGR